MKIGRAGADFNDMGRIAISILRYVAGLAAVLLLAGLAGATLVRLAPGFDADERELDARLGSETIAALRAERAGESNIVLYYWSFLAKLGRGDLGESRSLRQPVAGLLAERAPVTARLAGAGLAAGWAAGLALALVVSLGRIPGADLAAGAATGAFLCVPVALLAFAVLYWDGPIWICVAASIFPRVFRYTRNAIGEAAGAMHVLSARSRGVPGWVVAIRHVLPPVVPQTVALAGATVSAALGSAVPVEVLGDVPGIGQLVWKAASGRDLPVLVSLTLLVTAVTLAGNAMADGVLALSRRGKAS